jgi:hypothetical protein
MGISKQLTLALFGPTSRIRFESGALLTWTAEWGRVWSDLPCYPRGQSVGCLGWFPTSPDSTRFGGSCRFWRLSGRVRR